MKKWRNRFGVRPVNGRGHTPVTRISMGLETRIQLARSLKMFFSQLGHPEIL